MISNADCQKIKIFLHNTTSWRKKKVKGIHRNGDIRINSISNVPKGK